MHAEKFLPRVEGRSKVTGSAQYVADIREDVIGSAFDTAIPVTSTQASGRVIEIDARAALAIPGVRSVMTHENSPRLKRFVALGGDESGDVLPLQDNGIRYYGQCVALVIADSLEAAQEGTRLVSVKYGETGDARAFTLAQGESRLSFVSRAGIAPGKIEHGDAARDFAASAHKIDLEFHTAPHHHNAMEPSAVIARWDADGGVTIHVATQWNHSAAMAVGQAFGLRVLDRLPGLLARALGGVELNGKVRIVTALSGGAFGRNQTPVHILLAAMAAKATGRAVRVVLTREQTYSLLSYRGETRQRIRIGAQDDGRITALLNDADVAKGTAGGFIEPVGECTGKIYSSQSLFVRHRVAPLDLNAPGWMRAPGVTVAVFALESALDVLAHRLNIDPLDLRLRNYTEVDPETRRAWSSKSLKQCYAAAADAIGWRARPKGGTTDDSGRLIGYGMATAFHVNRQFPASARVSLLRDGSAVVFIAISELGQGIFTAMTKIAAEALGLARDRITLRTRESRLPFGSPTFGSAGTLSSGAAVWEAAQAVRKALVARAVRDRASPLFQQAPSSISLADGQLICANGNTDSVAAIMARHPKAEITGRASAGRTLGYSRYAKAAFGAQFAQVSIDPITMSVRVERVIGAFACGRPIDRTLVRSQLVGGMIWGVGQALFEESHVDPRTGQWVNANLAEAHVPTHADVPSVEAILIDEDDTRFHPLGIKGAGEIGLIGTSAAIANAIFDATGKRLQSLPMRIEHLLEPDLSEAPVAARIAEYAA